MGWGPGRQGEPDVGQGTRARAAALWAGVEARATAAAHQFARALASGARIDAPVAIVVAHPDDETLWAGSALRRLTRLKLIHATDGAPFDMHDAHDLGIERREDYAALRAVELERALEALDATPERRDYAIPDQGAVNRLPELIDRLAADLSDVAAVVTHPYEGGHPDHDALAFAVRAASIQIGRCTGGRRPAVVEFACYHEVDGERWFGRFWPDKDCPEEARLLDANDAARVDAAIRAHASQAAVVDGWRPAAERWRTAPLYDFTAPPPPGSALYDQFGWALTSDQWRARVAETGARAWA